MRLHASWPRESTKKKQISLFYRIKEQIEEKDIP